METLKQYEPIEVKTRVNQLIMALTNDTEQTLAQTSITHPNHFSQIQPVSQGEDTFVPVSREEFEVENGVALGGVLGGVLGAGVGAAFPVLFGTTSALFGAFSGFVAGGTIGATIGGLFTQNQYIKPMRKKERPTYGFTGAESLATQGTVIPLIYCSSRVNECGGVRHLGLLVMNRIVNLGNYGTLYQAYAMGAGMLDYEVPESGETLVEFLRRTMLIDGQPIENYYGDEIEVDIVRGQPTFLNPKEPLKPYPSEFRIYSQTMSPTGFNTVGTDLRSEFNKSKDEALKTFSADLSPSFNDDFWETKTFGDETYQYKSFETFRPRGEGMSVSLRFSGGVEIGFRHNRNENLRASLLMLPYEDTEYTAARDFWQPWADKYEPYSGVVVDESTSSYNAEVIATVNFYLDTSGRKKLKITLLRAYIPSATPETLLDINFNWGRGHYPFIISQKGTTKFNEDALSIQYHAVAPSSTLEKVAGNVTDEVKTSGCDYKILLPYPKQDTDDNDDDDTYTKRQLQKDITDGVYDTFTPSEVYAAAAVDTLEDGTYGYTEFRVLSKTPPRTLCTSRNVSKRIPIEGRIWSIWRGNYRTTKRCNQVEFNLSYNLYSRPKPPESAQNSKKSGKGGKGK